MKRNQDEYCKLLATTTRVAYNSVVSVYCPILGKDVVFNAKGFHHLQYKPGGTPRNASERIYKLTLFPLAPAVIKNALGIQDEREVLIRSGRKKNSKKIKAKQYALVATVGRKNPVAVRVIVLEVEGAPNPIFWSIMKD